ncbi:MAG: hypothetical protein Q9160_001660 [Pyrenula sp. 1 TL-2023]
MSQSLYKFSTETKDKLKKFRLGTSRAKGPQAAIYMIDIDSQEIKPADNETYVDMNDLADELPEASPRFILLSYPLTVVCLFKRLIDYVAYNVMVGPLVGAVELMRSTAEVNRVIEITEGEDLQDIAKKLGGED